MAKKLPKTNCVKSSILGSAIVPRLLYTPYGTVTPGGFGLWSYLILTVVAKRRDDHSGDGTLPDELAFAKHPDHASQLPASRVGVGSPPIAAK